MNPELQEIEQKVDTIEQNVGSGNVNSDEISGRFPGASEAVSLVNEFAGGDLLKNVAYIYNSTDVDAFGVFNPSLNETVDWVRVKKELERSGYVTNIPESPSESDLLYAYSPDKDPEEVTEEMRRLFEKKKSEGGSVIGIDIARIMDITDQMILDSDPDTITEDDKNNLRKVQLASIIAHEALHAKGGDEGPCQELQNSLLSWGMNRFNLPFETTGEMTHASNENSWYRKAQIAPFQWSLIETVLRSNQEVNFQEFATEGTKYDSVETLLENNLHTGDESGDKTCEENLTQERKEKGVAETESVTLEKMLMDKLPHALIIPIQKAASTNKLIKFASWRSNVGGPHIGGVFGYLNGFNAGWREPFEADDISDTHGYYDGESSDRRYWMRRYDERYGRGKIAKDRFGRSYWKNDIQIDLASPEHRNRPEKWNDRDTYWSGRSDFGTAGAVGNSLYNVTDNESKNYIVQILRRVGYYKKMVLSKKINVARLIVHEDALPHVVDALGDFPYAIFENDNLKDKVVVWITGDEDLEDIKEIEDNVNSGSNIDRVNSFVNLQGRLKETINKILSKCKILSQTYGIEDCFVVGGFPRTLATTKNFLEVNDLDFTSPVVENVQKLGGLLAADLGIVDIGFSQRTGTMSYEYEGVSMDFRGKRIFTEGVRPLMREENISTTPIHLDVYARDFTVNSLLYSFIDNNIYDITGKAMDDIEAKIVRPILNPDVVIPINPLMVTRAIILNLRGYSIDPELDESIHRNKELLFDGAKVSEKRLAYEYEKIIGYGPDGEYMLKEYGLEKLKEIHAKVVKEQPEFFETV
jgi:hypothetical protein